MPRRPTLSRFCAALTAFSLLAGCAVRAAVTHEPGAFAVMGDTPYTEGEVRRLDELIDDVNAARPAFLAHVGDITSGRGPCTDDWFRARKAQFDRLRVPLVLLPGDNDWVDCHRSGFDPLERLRFWRSLFCNSSLKIEKQPGEYCEHVRWQHEGWLFVALNVQGSNDNVRMADEHATRTRAVLAWIDDAEKTFAERQLKGLVLLMQANPFLKPRGGAPNGFTPVLQRIESLAGKYPERVVLVHGDTHTFRDDRPMTGLRRIEVYGSPFVGWLQLRPGDGRLELELGGLY